MSIIYDDDDYLIILLVTQNTTLKFDEKLKNKKKLQYNNGM